MEIPDGTGGLGARLLGPRELPYWDRGRLARSPSNLNSLNNHGNPLPAADAGGGQTKPLTAAVEFVK